MEFEEMSGFDKELWIKSKGHPVPPYHMTGKGEMIGTRIIQCFYKKDGRWYADLPGLPEEETEMVSGADKFLDMVSNGRDWCELILISDIEPMPEDVDYYIQYELEANTTPPTSGKTYTCRVDNVHRGTDKSIEGMKMWLCDCIYYLWEKAPGRIFICDKRWITWKTV